MERTLSLCKGKDLKDPPSPMFQLSDEAQRKTMSRELPSPGVTARILKLHTLELFQPCLGAAGTAQYSQGTGLVNGI